MAPTTFPDPRSELSDPAELFILYFDYYRGTVADKLEGLSDAQLRSAPLPSGWTLLEMVKHLAFMERRWFSWGFLGEPVADPWGDSQGAPDAAWLVPPDRSLDDVAGLLDEQAAVTERVLTSAALDDPAATGGRYNPRPADVFEASGRSIATIMDLWPGLLALAVLLNLIELILRKWKGVLEALHLRPAEA